VTTGFSYNNIIIRLIVVSLMFLLCLNPTYSQNRDSLTIVRLPDVRIGGEYFKVQTEPAAIQTLTLKQLNNLPSLQLSDALKYMSGVVVKDYGGTGGVKTVSVRGLGAQHTGVAYDGIVLTDCQTGQIDLGRLSLDNVSEVSVLTGLDFQLMQPARWFSFSNLLKINTLNTIPTKPVALKVSMTVGSFGYYNPQLYFTNIIRNKKHRERYVLWNILGNYTYSKGNYPYELHYGGINDSVSYERRQNSDVSIINAEANVRYHIDNYQRLDLKAYYYDSERGLPSATVFYNLDSRQRMWNRNAFGQLRYQVHFRPRSVQQNEFPRWSYLLCAKYNYDYTRYLDPDYLNVEGYLDNRYQQYEGYLSNTVSWIAMRRQTSDSDNVDHSSKDLFFSLSNDLFYNTLKANTLTCDDPVRFTTLTALTGGFQHPKFKIMANVLLTTVSSYAQQEQLSDDYIHVSPAVSASYHIKKGVSLRAFYKNIFRMPTFNDLYYREVGNINLLPEKTHQWDLGATLEPPRFCYGRMMIFSSLDGYFNIVKDKIVAFPSHNLFSWTMLNYGLVWIGGAELNANWEYQFVKHYYVRLNGNCTYQKAIDRTNPSDKTYNHQIPYTPEWSGSTSVSLETPWFTISYALICCGKRYALGQNIPANEVAGYTDHSITIGHEYNVRKSKLGIKLELLNLADAHYEIIRNYPMQGRSFRLKLWYGF